MVRRFVPCLGEIWYNGSQVCTMLGEFWYNGCSLYHVRGDFGTMVLRFVPC